MTTLVFNREGSPAFRGSLASQALQVLLTSSLGDTFYAGSERITGEILVVLKAASRDDPEGFARTLIYAREAGCMRLLPTLGTAVLSLHSPDLFARVFPRVVKTPRELRDFLLMVRRTDLRQGLGRSVKRAVSSWLLNLSEYHLLKYARKRGKFSLRDVLRLVRPKARTERQQVLLRLLARGLRSVPFEELAADFPQVACWRSFQDEQDPSRRLALIAEGKLPYEIVLGCCRPDRELWRAVLHQMPMLALLRHLVTLIRRGVLSQPAESDYVMERLTDGSAIKASRVLPFRFYSAWLALQEVAPFRCRRGAPRPTREADPGFWLNRCFENLCQSLERALELSLDNLPDLGSRVCLAVDVSGSMEQPLLRTATPRKRPKRGVRLVDLAALFAAGWVRRYGNRVRVIPFDHRPLPFLASQEEGAFQTLERLSSLCGGGTSLGAPVQLLLEEGRIVDHFVGVTDSEEWGCSGFLPAWRQYRRQLNPKAQAYLLTLAPYRDLVAPDSEPGIHHFFGWSEELVRHLALCAAGGTQMGAVYEWTKDF